MQKNNFILEHYPDKLQAKIERRDRQKRANTPNYINGNIFQLVLDDLKLWRVGTLKVSFKGGDASLHQKIANVANSWSDFGNLQFDFGYDPESGEYRKWTTRDKSHIRVGFEYDGYWSLVGNDSVDEEIIDPGDISLNLSGFDALLPSNWEGTVLHEFGHAIGFHHEHQTQDIECDFDWPKLYDYLGGPPNYWPKSKVDHNLRQLRTGSYTYSAHDRHSIMHYSFPAWMFITKEESRCFTDENNTLSEEDKKMMSIAYPFANEDVQKLDSYRMGNLEVLIETKGTTESIHNLHKKHLEYYQAQRTDM
ncbi:hypothetical protein [Flagellimonas sp.]|uniref:hypothetical protein n=1 Tax=Flagellimonas sp. TaxID=2058762 RepID=UPI003B50A27D